MSTVKDFRCNSCGAALPIPKNSKGHVKCPSCNTECIIEGLVKNAEMAAKENINSGFPLVAPPRVLHSTLVKYISESPSMPLDVFEKGEVIREEHYCVPAYLFFCSGTASYTYQAGNERSQVVVRDNGQKSWEETRTRTEWTQMNGTANASATVFAPGNRTFAAQIHKLYMFLDSNKLVDFDELDFPHDVVTETYNFPQAASFNEYVQPYMEKLLKKKAEESLAGKNTRQLSMGGGSRLDKDEVVRVFLGLYRIVFKYNGKEYSVWTTGNAKKTYHDGMPEDEQRKTALEEKKQAKSSGVASITRPKTGFLNFGKWIGIILTIFGVLFTFGGAGAAALVFIIPGLALALGCGIPRHNKIKGYDEKLNNAEATFQKEIDDFNAQVSDVVEQFKSQKKALRGIYEGLTGDAGAF